MKALLIAMREVLKTWWHYRHSVGQYGAFFCVWLTPTQTETVIVMSKILQLEPRDVIQFALRMLAKSIPDALGIQTSIQPQD